MADLTDTDRLYAALGIASGDLESSEVEKYENAIAAASDALRSWADRSFETPQVTETRTFQYDGSGFLSIDDCTDITDVSVVVPNASDRPLVTAEYGMDPSGNVIDYITLAPHWGLVSRQMGFAYNLDRYEGPLPGSRQIKVTANWGWPAIPEAVQQAAVWTAIALAENPKPLISESIEGYSRTIGPAPFDAIPPRAMALLTPYTKVKV